MTRSEKPLQIVSARREDERSFTSFRMTGGRFAVSCAIHDPLGETVADRELKKRRREILHCVQDDRGLGTE
jgi:hypothetical protein